MATVTCISSVEVQQIKWLYGEQVLVMATSQQMMNLTFHVEDSTHNETYTCLVTAISNITVEQTVTMNVSGKFGSAEFITKCNLLTYHFPVPHDAIEVSIITTGQVIAGQNYSMTCNVTKRVDGLTNSPLTAVWTVEEVPVIEGNNIQLVTEIQNLSTTSTILFTPLTTSNALLQGYMCHGRLTSPALSTPLVYSVVHNLTVQSKMTMLIQNCIHAFTTFICMQYLLQLSGLMFSLVHHTSVEHYRCHVL